MPLTQNNSQRWKHASVQDGPRRDVPICKRVTRTEQSPRAAGHDDDDCRTGLTRNQFKTTTGNQNQELNKGMNENNARAANSGCSQTNAIQKNLRYMAQAQSGPAIGKNPSVFQIPQIYSNAKRQKHYNEDARQPQKPMIGAACPCVRGCNLTTPVMGQGVNQITQNATKKASKASIDAIGKIKRQSHRIAQCRTCLARGNQCSQEGTYQGRFADWQTAGAALQRQQFRALTNWLTRKNLLILRSHQSTLPNRC